MMQRVRSQQQIQRKPQNTIISGLKTHQNTKNTLENSINQSLPLVSSQQSYKKTDQNDKIQKTQFLNLHSPHFVQQLQQANFQQSKQELLQKIEIFYNSLYSPQLCEAFQDHDQINQFDQIDQVTDFISICLSDDLKDCKQKLLLIWAHYPMLGQFLQWIYDATPLPFFKELILITSKIIISSFWCTQSNPLIKILDLSKNIIFLNHIFNDESLKIFKVGLEIIGFNLYILTGSTDLLNFNANFTQKVLEIIEMSIKQDASDQPQTQESILPPKSKKSKKSKRIKKHKQIPQ